MNACDTPPPTPLFTEADLLPEPESEHNGWIDTQRAERLPGASVHEKRKIRVSLRHVLSGALPMPAAAVALAVDSTSEEAYRVACRTAWSKPRFADTCPWMSADFESCRQLAATHCHEATLADVVVAIEGDDDERAGTLTTDLLRSDRDRLLTARSAVAYAIAMRDFSDALDIASRTMVMWPRTRERFRDHVPDATWSVPPPGQARVGAYLFVVAQADRIAAGGHGRFAQLFFDRGETLRVLGESQHAFRPRRNDPTWWLDNAVGDRLLDSQWPAFYDAPSDVRARFDTTLVHARTLVNPDRP